MEAVKILIVEDEAIIASTMEARLEKMGYNVLDTLHSGEDALHLLKKITPDLVLIDINLEKGGGTLDGIETAEKINQSFEVPIIYLSAFSDQETIERAKKTAPMTYLLKPFKEKDVQVAIEMAISRYSKNQNKTKTQGTIIDDAFLIKDSIFIKEEAIYVKIKIASILFLQSSSNYVLIHTKEKSHVLCNTLTYTSELINKPNFFRVHQSYVVNMEHIDAFEKDCIYIGNHNIPISRANQTAFIQHLQVLKAK